MDSSLKPFTLVFMGQPATKKNGATINTKSKRPQLIASEAYRKYERSCRSQLLILKQRLGRLPHYSLPIHLTCKYFLKDRKSYPDLVGLMQATADILEDEYTIIHHKRKLSCKWVLSNDRIIKTWDGTEIAGIDKYNPRAEITITPLSTSIAIETDPYIIKQLEEMQQAKLFI